MRTHKTMLTGAVVVFVAALSAVALAGQKPSTTPLPPMPTEPMKASVDDISNHPDRFYGKHVRVTEDVARVLAPRIFTLDEEAILGMGKDVMVVGPKGVSVKEDQQVEVIGIVREFAWTELEKEKFDFDFKREWQLEFKSRPVIYATSVRAVKTR